MFPRFYYLFKHSSFISVVSSSGWLVGRPVGRLMYWHHNKFSFWQPLPLELVPTVVAVHQQAFTGTPRKWVVRLGHTRDQEEAQGDWWGTVWPSLRREAKGSVGTIFEWVFLCNFVPTAPSFLVYAQALPSRPCGSQVKQSLCYDAIKPRKCLRMALGCSCDMNPA